MMNKMNNAQNNNINNNKSSSKKIQNITKDGTNKNSKTKKDNNPSTANNIEAKQGLSSSTSSEDMTTIWRI
jgi:hypothetical protein